MLTTTPPLKLRKTILLESDYVFDYLLIPNSTNSNTNKPSYRSNFTLNETSTEWLTAVCTAIEEAQEVICLSSFLLEASPLMEVLQRATERGVQVYLLTSTVHLEQNRTSDDTDDAHQASFKKLLTEVIQHRMLLRCARDLHAKFLLIDPKSQQANGWLTTCNFTRRGMTKNRELALRLDGERVTELLRCFVRQFWEATTHEQDETADFRSVQPANRFRYDKPSQLLTTNTRFQETHLRDHLLQQLRRAKRSIRLGTYALDPQHECYKMLLQRCQEGLDVQLFVREDARIDTQKLVDLTAAGARIFLHPDQHAKFLLIDGEQGTVFTANFSRFGLDMGFEVGFALQPAEVNTLSQLVKRWHITFPAQLLGKVPIANVPTGARRVTRKGSEPLRLNDMDAATRTVEVKYVHQLMKEWQLGQQFPIDRQVRHAFTFEGIFSILEPEAVQQLQEPLPGAGWYTAQLRNNKKRVVLLTDKVDLEALMNSNILKKYRKEAVYGYASPVPMD